MDLISGCTCATRAAFCAGVKKSADTVISLPSAATRTICGAHTPSVALIDSQLGYRIGICVKATLGRGAWPVAPSATSLASTVLKRLSSGTLAVPASVDTSVPLMAAPVRADTTLRRVRSLSSTCGPTESLTRRSVGTSAKYCCARRAEQLVRQRQVDRSGSSR